MEISWKWLNLCFGLLFFQLCNGFPINLEDSVADQHTQLLTGLVAVLLTVCSVVLLAGCLCCQRRNGFKEFRDSPVVASTASNLDHGHVNPIANGEFTIFTPLSPPHYNNNVFLASEQIITRTSEDYILGDIDVSSWFNGPDKDFPRIKLKYIQELGKGWFGKVVEGAAQDVSAHRTWTPVVVRILEASANSKKRVLFLHEAEIYRCSPHPNLLSLVGRCLETVPLLLLQEHCPQGDLKNYLRTNKANAEKLLSTDSPLMWCCQLTSALKHLHDNHMVHSDLATRNCQLTNDLTLKLGDYGLGVFKYPEDYYQGSHDVPVRWCSPESLNCTSTTIQPKKITPEANVWSLGVAMWEICECGEQPYSNLSDDEMVTQVFGPTKLRLSRPRFPVLYTDYIFRLMQLCWTNAESRPSVSQINLMLSDLLQVHKNTKNTQSVSVDEFDKRWQSLKPNIIVKTDNHEPGAVSIEMDESDIITPKPLSPSMINLRGSLNNLLEVDAQPPMESWLENVATRTNDLSYIKGLSDAMKDLDNALASESVSSSASTPPQPKANRESKIDFELGPMSSDVNRKFPEPTNQNDSLTDSMVFVQRTSSESDTEEENWKKKVERGAYTEKVRLKSRSVADLMVLTHVDYSESESETPLHSLDYKVNRNGKKNNLETVSVSFSSEGNLLNIEDNFQEELKKLQVERRDSLLFVPDNNSQSSVDKIDSEVAYSSPNKNLLQELNRPSEIKPANQIYNVFNVTIDKYGPLHVNSTKLNEIINMNDGTNDYSLNRQDSENKSDLGYNTLHNSEKNSDFGSADEENISEYREGTYHLINKERIEETENKKSVLDLELWLDRGNAINEFYLHEHSVKPGEEENIINEDCIKDSGLFLEVDRCRESNSSGTEKEDLLNQKRSDGNEEGGIKNISEEIMNEQNKNAILEVEVTLNTEVSNINNGKEASSESEVTNAEKSTIVDHTNEKMEEETECDGGNGMDEETSNYNSKDDEKYLLPLSEVLLKIDEGNNDVNIDEKQNLNSFSSEKNLIVKTETINDIKNGENQNLNNCFEELKANLDDFSDEEKYNINKKGEDIDLIKIEDEENFGCKVGCTDQEIFIENLHEERGKMKEANNNNAVDIEKLINNPDNVLHQDQKEDSITQRSSEDYNTHSVCEEIGEEITVQDLVCEKMESKITVEGIDILNTEDIPEELAGHKKHSGEDINENLNKEIEDIQGNATELDDKCIFEQPTLYENRNKYDGEILSSKEHIENGSEEEILLKEEDKCDIIEAIRDTNSAIKVFKNKDNVTNIQPVDLEEEREVACQRVSIDTSKIKIYTDGDQKTDYKDATGKSYKLGTPFVREDQGAVDGNNCENKIFDDKQEVVESNQLVKCVGELQKEYEGTKSTELLNMDEEDTEKLSELECCLEKSITHDVLKDTIDTNNSGINVCVDKEEIVRDTESIKFLEEDNAFLQNENTNSNELEEHKNVDELTTYKENNKNFVEQGYHIEKVDYVDANSNDEILFKEDVERCIQSEIGPNEYDQNKTTGVAINPSSIGLDISMAEESIERKQPRNCLEDIESAFEKNKENIEMYLNKELCFEKENKDKKCDSIFNPKHNDTSETENKESVDLFPKSERQCDDKEEQSIKNEEVVQDSKCLIADEVEIHKEECELSSLFKDSVKECLEQECYNKYSMEHHLEDMAHNHTKVSNGEDIENQIDLNKEPENGLIIMNEHVNSQEDEIATQQINLDSRTEDKKISNIVSEGLLVDLSEEINGHLNEKDISQSVSVEDHQKTLAFGIPKFELEGIIKDQKIELAEAECNMNKTDDEKLTSQNRSTNKTNEVPKLMDLIQNNDNLMDYIIANYDSEISDKNKAILDLDIKSSTKNSESHVPSDSSKENEPMENKSSECLPPKIDFDLSQEQKEAMPNSLTHSNVFTSTPFKKKPIVEGFSSLRNLNVFEPSLTYQEQLQFSSNFVPQDKPVGKSLNYSLETWDNFLEKTMETQRQQDNEILFDSFSSEPHSLLFLENERGSEGTDEENDVVTRTDKTYVKENNATFTVSDKEARDYSKFEADLENTHSLRSTDESQEELGTWEKGEGWYLHPQSNNDQLSGNLEVPHCSKTDTYVSGFNMDDEIMAAIRNELLQKLPHAQGSSNDKVREEEEWESGEHSEVFLRYNVYNTPLSPIPEESCLEEPDGVEESGQATPK